MLKLLERSIASIGNRLVLLAPEHQAVPAFFRGVQFDTAAHTGRMAELQTLRGGIYVADGAVAPEQLINGRHKTPEDGRSWHLLMLNQQSRVSSCVWFLHHDRASSVAELRVSNCPLNRQPPTQALLRGALDAEMARARQQAFAYAEVGGWAVIKESRCTSEGLLLALAAYSLGRAFGGALGLTTATVRHSSSTILRRLGGTDLEFGGQRVPSYFDDRYGCDMELLRFDSERPNARYAGLIDALKGQLAEVAVVATERARDLAAPRRRAA